MPHDVFDDDDGAVHNHAEVQCAERKQVRRDFVQIQTNRSEQERERNRHRDNQRSTDIAEKEKQDHRNQQYAFRKIVQDGVRRVVDQIAAVEERNDLHAFGQDAFVQLLHLGVNSVQGAVGLRAFLQQHDPLDHVVVVDRCAVFAPPGFSYLPKADFGPLRYLGDVFHAKWGAGLRFQDSLFDVLNAGDQTQRANVYLLQAGLDETSTGIHVVVGQLLLDLADRQPIGDQPGGINAHLIFACGAAETHHIDDIRHRLELFFEGPVFQRFQFHQIVFRIGALQRIPVNLADRAVVRAHLRLQIIWQSHLRQPFEHLLAVPVVAGAVVKNEHHAGKAKQRNGTQMRQVRQSVHLDFNRNGDLLFDFFGGAPGPLGDDLDIIIGNVGIRLDGEIVKGDRSPNEQENGDRQHDEAVVQREVDDCADHRMVLGVAARFIGPLLFRGILHHQCVYNDRLPGLDAGEYQLHLVGESGAGFYFDTAEFFVASGHVDPIAVVQVQNRGGGHDGNALFFLAVEGGVHVHAYAH